MPKHRIRKPHTSRRAPPLKDSDYDHEIALVDEADAAAASDAGNQPTTTPATEPASTAPARGLSQDSGEGPSTIGASVNTIDPLVRAPTTTSQSSSSRRRHRSNDSAKETGQPDPLDANGGLTINIQQPTPFETPVATMPATQGTGARTDRPRTADAESAIDVLYENERGGMLCGIPLFSSKALGWRDPPTWTNVAHKPSATGISTAQVPDPTWRWAWPEWRVNHDEGVDKDGWEYAFNFRGFTWHGPKWWNSFVRRRAWIRRRVKRAQAHGSLHGSGGLQPEYFVVRSSAEMQRSSKELSRPGSRRGAGASSIISASVASQAGGGGGGGCGSSSIIAGAGAEAEALDITDVDTLMAVLRTSRIDREKIEAVENFLENGSDLKELDQVMHEIMGLFVFQASRRVLLKRLTDLCDDEEADAAGDDEKAPAKAPATEAQDTNRHPTNTPAAEGVGGAEGRAANLKAAVTHAAEEVRRLEYWSDVKGIAESKVKEGCCDVEEARSRKNRSRSATPTRDAGR